MAISIHFAGHCIDLSVVASSSARATSLIYASLPLPTAACHHRGATRATYRSAQLRDERLSCRMLEPGGTSRSFQRNLMRAPDVSGLTPVPCERTPAHRGRLVHSCVAEFAWKRSSALPSTTGWQWRRRARGIRSFHCEMVDGQVDEMIASGRNTTWGL